MVSGPVVIKEKLIKAVELIFDSFEKHEIDDVTAFCACRSIQRELEKRLGFKICIESEDEQ